MYKNLQQDKVSVVLTWSDSSLILDYNTTFFSTLSFLTHQRTNFGYHCDFGSDKYIYSNMVNTDRSNVHTILSGKTSVPTHK